MIETNLTKRGISAAKYTIIFRLLTQSFGILTTILLVRSLTKHDFGIYNLLYSLISLLGMIFSFGISNTLQRYMPEYYSKEEYIVAHSLYRNASLLRLLTTIAILSILFCAWEQLAPLLKIKEYKNYLFLFSFIIIIHLQRFLLETTLNSYLLQKYSQGISVLFVLIKGFGYGIALILKQNLWFILFIDLCAYLSVFILLQLVYLKKIPRDSGAIKSLSGAERKRVWRYALFYNFNDAGAGLLDANFDNFIIVMLLDPISVGAYAFCLRLTKMIERVLPINYLIDVFRPLFFHNSHNKKTNHINSNYQILLKCYYIFQIPIFFFLLLYSSDLIAILFGDKYVEYSSLLTGVYFFSLLNAFQIPLSLVVQLKEKVDIILYSKIFAIYNIFADVILIHLWGLWGAVVATGTATLGKNIFIWYFVRQEATWKGLSQFFYRILFFWIFISIPCYFTNVAIQNNLIRICIGITIFLASFIIFFRFLRLKQKEKDLIYKIVMQSEKNNFITKLSKGLGLV